MIFQNAEDCVNHIKQEGGFIGIVKGCFEILHPLHLEYFEKCKRFCSKLYVLLDSDTLIYENKNKIPLFSERDRAYMVDNLKQVSGVYVFESHNIMRSMISNMKGECNKIIVFSNSDTIYGVKLFEYGKGVENMIIPDTMKFHSVTEIRNFLKQQAV